MITQKEMLTYMTTNIVNTFKERTVCGKCWENRVGGMGENR